MLKSFVETIEKVKGVKRVDYPALLIEQLHATVGKIQLVLLFFGGTLLIISLILLNNTIRLAIFSRRYLINTMKLVGATKWFIMKPFLGSSFRCGLGAGVLASMLFVGVIYLLNESIPELLVLAPLERVGIIVGVMVVGGVLISLLFTLFAVNKFVNMKSNKIYLY